MRGSRARRWRLRRMLFPSSDGYRVRACTHKIAIGDSGLINVRLGPLCRLKSDISRGPRSCHEPTFSPNGTLWNVSAWGSFRLDARGLDHLGPLIDLVGNEFSEFGGSQ